MNEAKSGTNSTLLMLTITAAILTVVSSRSVRIANLIMSGRGLKEKAWARFGQNQAKIEINYAKTTEEYYEVSADGYFEVEYEGKSSKMDISDIEYEKSTIYLIWRTSVFPLFIEDVTNPHEVYKLQVNQNNNKQIYDDCLFRIIMIEDNELVSIDPKQLFLHIHDKQIYQNWIPVREIGGDKFDTTEYFRGISGHGIDIKYKDQVIHEDFRCKLHDINTIYVRKDGNKIEVAEMADLSNGPMTEWMSLICFLIYALIWKIYRNLSVMRRLYYGKRKYYQVKKIRNETADEGKDILKEEKDLDYIDSYRGIGVMLLLYVISGGSNYKTFEPSIWDGLTIGDLPLYLISWVMGYCIVLSVNKHHDELVLKREAYLRRQLIWVSFYKAFLMTCLGLIYNRNTNFSTARISSFMFRLGIGYFVVYLVHVLLPYNRYNKKATGYHSKVWYIKLGIFASLLALNAAVTLFVKAPGCPRGYTGPGANYITSEGYNMTQCAGGINSYIDRAIYGEERMPTTTALCHQYYSCSSFDEYGLLGTLNFIAGVGFGSMAGLLYLQFKKNLLLFLIKLSLQAMASVFASMVLIGIPSYMIIPINQQLYSVSYVLICNGIATVCFLVLFLLSIKHFWNGWPFKTVGKNALFILSWQQFMTNRFPFGFLHNGNHFDATLSAMLNCSIWMIVAVFLHSYRFYIKY